MFPYRDDNPTLRPAVVTAGLIGVNLVVWVVAQGAGAEPALLASIHRLGLVPAEVTGRWYTVLTSMFSHGGWFHLIGNMWFLWVFGNNVEDAMGRARFVAFYLLGGLAAAAAQVLATPGSAIPMVGASGAISAVMGGYLVLYPRVRVHMLVFLGFFITTVAVPAWLMLIYWALLQGLGSLPALAGAEPGGGVAFLAHLGGFVAGVLTIKLFARADYVAAHRDARRRISPFRA